MRERTDEKIVFNAHIREHVPALRHVRDTHPRHLMGRERHEIASIEFDSAGDVRNKPRYCAQERALAGSIRADDADEVAPFDFKRDAVQDLRASVIGTKLGDA
jgi:hypothetical protein